MLQFFKKTVVPQAICGIRMVTNGLAILLMVRSHCQIFMVCDHGHVTAAPI